MIRYITIVIALLCAIPAWAQQITGKIFDAYTNTPIEGANILLSNGKGTTTDKSGQFTFNCEEGLTLTVTHISYETLKSEKLVCGENVQLGLIPSTKNLNAVEINASTSDDAKMLEQAQSVSMLSRTDLTRSTGLFLEESMNLEPGIRLDKRTMSGGQRLTIRGYGNSTNFNGVGYRAYLNGIPVSDASGTTLLDDIDFSTLGKVEVIKGPASSLYGSNIAGVLNMYTLRPTPGETSISEEVVGGSFGLFRTNTRIASATDKSSILLNYGHQNYDSYRVHSASKKDYATFVGDFRPNEKQTFTAYLSYNHSYDELAGQLDSASFFSKDNVGESRYLANDGHVEIESFRAGLSHKYYFSKHVSNVTSGFVSGVRHHQTYAVGMNDNNYQNVGGRSEFRFAFEGEKVSLNGTVGGEFQKTSGIYKTYSMTDGVLGPMSTDNDVDAMQYYTFTQWDLSLPYEFKLTLGASINFLEYSIADQLANTSNPTHEDASGYKTFDPVVTPRIALQKMVNQNASVYVSVSQGYTPPSTSDVVVPYTGEVLTDLQAEMGTQYEIGTKGSAFDNKLSWQVALFSLQIKDKLTTQSFADDTGTVLYTYAVNSGDQVDNGIEVALAYTAINDDSKIISYFRPFGSFTYSSFTYTDFKSDNDNDAGTVDYTDNTVVGVPPVVANAGFDLGTKWGFYLNGTIQYVDEMYTSFDNNHKAPDFTLVNGKIGYKTTLGEHLSLDVFAGGKNLTNSLHYNMVFLNITRGSSIYVPGSYFATFYGGVNLKYRF
tara:strand:- start:3098 stop:5416 length:2319 start_codon:yes stop_codon:yes gene_type:complete